MYSGSVREGVVGTEAIDVGCEKPAVGERIALAGGRPPND